MKRRIWLVVLIIVLLTACNGDNTDTKTQSIISESPDYLNLELEKNIIVDAKVYGPTKEKYEIYNIKRKSFDMDKIKELFFKGKDVEIISYDNNVSQNINDTVNFLYFTDGEIRMQSKGFNTSFHYAFMNEDYYIRPIDIKKESEENINSPTEGEVFALINEIKDVLGLELEEKPYIFENLDGKEIEKIIKDKQYDVNMIEQFKIKTEWEEDEGCYYVLWNFQVDGIPILTGNYDLNTVEGISWANQGSYLFACIDKNGIRALEICMVYDILSKEDQSNYVINLEDALNQVKYYYRNIILEYGVNIDDIRFSYVPSLVDYDNKEYKLIPAWVISTKQFMNESGESVKYKVFRINGITGEIM